MQLRGVARIVEAPLHSAACSVLQKFWGKFFKLVRVINVD
jgi:hypothetical protein